MTTANTQKAGMPSHFQPLNVKSPLDNVKPSLPAAVRHIFINLHIALANLKAVELTGTTFLNNFKNKLNNDHDFFKQNFTEDQEYKDFLESVKPLKALTLEDFYNEPEVASPLLTTTESRFQQFLKQRKEKFDLSFATMQKEEKETLRSNYEKALMQIYQPLEAFAHHTRPNHRYTQSIVDYVNNHMGNQNKQENKIKFASYDWKIQDSELKKQDHFMDSNGKPIFVQYDKNNEVIEVKFGPGGSIHDALAISIAAKNGPPYRIEVATLSSDIIKSRMEPGLLQLLFVVMYATLDFVLKRGQKKEFYKALAETGLPAEQVSLVDKKGNPISISPKELEKIRQISQQLAAKELEKLKKCISDLKAKQLTGEENTHAVEENQENMSSNPVRALSRR